jgi:hypothetical protein
MTIAERFVYYSLEYAGVLLVILFITLISALNHDDK